MFVSLTNIDHLQGLMPLSWLVTGEKGKYLGNKGNLTLRLLMSYIYIYIYTYMELLVKPEMLTSYMYGPTFGNAETVSFYLLHNYLVNCKNYKVSRCVFSPVCS